MPSIAFNLFVSGLLFGSGPCVASCGPILVSYIAGTKKNIFKGLMVYVLFSLARISIYLLLSLAIFFLGRFTLERLLGDLSKYVLIFGGCFIVLIGILTILGEKIEIKPLGFLYKNILNYDQKSIVIIGLIIGLLPCAPLVGLLSYVGLISRTWLQSLIYGFSFGLGTLVSPLLLLAIFAGFIPQFLIDKKAAYARVLSFVCGLIIIFLGVQLIIRAFQ